jgi:hypothetical protein
MQEWGVVGLDEQVAQHTAVAERPTTMPERVMCSDAEFSGPGRISAPAILDNSG